MRRAPRLDGNHHEVVAALERLGCSVWSSAAVGCGFPDLVVGLFGLTMLIEIKDGRLPPSRRELTLDEVAFHSGFRGHRAVVASAAEAVAVVRHHVSKHAKEVVSR